MQPPRDKIFDDLAKELRAGLICPVFLGSAEKGNGIVRLLKALRHEVPFVAETARRLKLENARSAAQVVKTLHTGHGGKLSIARVLTGEIAEGANVTGANVTARVAGIFSMLGQEPRKRGTAKAGDTVALGRLEEIRTGETITAEPGGIVQVPQPAAPQSVYAVALGLKDRKDEVKLSSALGKLLEEDTSLSVDHNKDTHQLLLLGQGEMHLRVALERLQRKYGVAVERKRRLIPYKETIKKSARSSRAGTASSVT
jgi:elongation factor G